MTSRGVAHNGQHDSLLPQKRRADCTQEGGLSPRICLTVAEHMRGVLVPHMMERKQGKQHRRCATVRTDGAARGETELAIVHSRRVATVSH